MSDRREHARRAAAEARTLKAAKAEARARVAREQARSRELAKEHDKDLMAALRHLGFSVGEARRAIESCEDIPDAPLEERVRAALKFLSPNARRVTPSSASIAAIPGAVV